MVTTQLELEPMTAAPRGRCPEVRKAWRYLKATHESVAGLLDSFNIVHEKKVSGRRNGQGRLGRDEVDLLRAALVFTSSGLDASCHALVADSVPGLIDRTGSVASRKFEDFLTEQLRKPSAAFQDAVKHPEPRAEFIRLYIRARATASYQGSGDLKDRVKGLLGVPNSVVPDETIDALDPFFTARNNIVHRLDYKDPETDSRARHDRAGSEVVDECNRALEVVAKIILGTAEVINSK